jgi:hypothetical protein
MMSEHPALRFRWDGEAAVPVQPRVADKYLVVGEVYSWIEHHERSDASHRRYFAGVRDAWLSLPDHLALEYPTPDALRKQGLIETGYFTERRFIASSPAEARKLAAWLPKGDGVRVSVAGNAIVERTAMSQSKRAMGKAMFQKSVADVDAWCAELIGVDVQTLRREAGRAA